MRLRKAHRAFLTHQRVARLGTADPRGRPHVVPVCFVVVGDTLCFASGKSGRKMAHMRANAHVALTVDDYSEAWGGLRGVTVSGVARLFEGGPRFRRVRKLLYAKYQQYATDAALDEADSVVVEVTPSRVFAWGL